MSTIEYEAVIGLEVHAQLATKTKIFSPTSTTFGAAPNDNVSAGDAAMPGTLPVLNRDAVTLAMRAGMALGCDVQRRSIFDRKNYFYPDLPTGYQISQNDYPICLGGKLDVEVDGHTHTITLTRIHMEQDAGKLVHSETEAVSHVDLNRAGNPLIEIVTDPVIFDPDVAAAFFKELRALLVAVGANDGNMAEGSLRCDANVSVRPKGTDKLGTRAEIKNLNSFRFVKEALVYEIQRQIHVLNHGGTLVQETRLWNPHDKKTRSMRTKEDATDYRYVPDPDIPPLVIDDAWFAQVQKSLPELPQAQRARLQSSYGLSAYDAGVLVDGDGYVTLLDEIIQAGADAKLAANLLLGPVATSLNEHRLFYIPEENVFASAEGFVLSGGPLAALLALQQQDTVHAGSIRIIYDRMILDGGDPEAIMEEEGLRQIQDESALDAWIDQALAQNADAVAAYRAGKKKAVGAILGAVMRASGGQANPNKARARLLERLNQYA